MNGIYWGLTAMDLMGALGEMCRDEVISFVSQCQHESGGFRASIGHDPSLLCTLSAIQVHPSFMQTFNHSPDFLV